MSLRCHRPAGPKGCCCPSSPKISLKSSSSLPGQFAVVIGFDSSGFTPSLDRRRQLEQFMLSYNVTTFTDCHDAVLQLLLFNSRACGHKRTAVSWFDKSKMQVASSPSSGSSRANFWLQLQGKVVCPLWLSFPR